MSEGFLYIATGSEYVNEARYSASKLRESMPNANITIITDKQISDDLFDNIVKTEPHSDYSVKIENMTSEFYEKTIFLDTDTYIANDVSELFDILDDFDLLCASKQDFYVRPDFPNDIPNIYPEFNTGVIGLRKNNRIKKFLSSWQECYMEGHCHDQVSFRTALYNSNVHYHQLSPEYNCRFTRPGQLNGEAKIFHGRPINMRYGSENLTNILKGWRMA